MDERSGRFRVYRVVESVPHLNFQAVATPRLYSVYQSGYADRQEAVDDLRTGDLVEATLVGDPADESEPWRLTALDRVDRVRTYVAVDADPPAVARDCWTPDQTDPGYAVLTEGEIPVGVCGVQPRAPLPNGAFVPNVLTGLLPLEPQFGSVPEVGDPAVEAGFVDPDPPDASSYSTPYGVVFLFTDPSAPIAERVRDRYGWTPGVDTRPAFDPYGI
jgi:hypothetical protein